MKNREITLGEMQNIEFGILKFFKKLCDENDLRYYLAYGTLLGAVRHQGFIPWDDDVDVWMPREDYYRFIEIMKVEKQMNYKLISVDTYTNFTAPLPKIIDARTILIQQYDLVEKIPLGVYIDIFVMDGLGDNQEEAIQLYNEACKLHIKWERADTALFSPNKSKIYGLLRWVRNSPYKLGRGYRYYLSKKRENNSRYSFYDSKYVASLDMIFRSSEESIFEQLWFGEGITMLFEGTEFRVPTEYDKVLRSYYGDYMVLPPEERRITHHSYTVKWK